MRVKAALTRGLALSIMILVAVAAAPLAASEEEVRLTNHPGAICKNSISAQGSRITYQDNGIHLDSYLSPGEVWVVCPLTRHTTRGNGATVHVTVTHAATQTISCAVYSVEYWGAVLMAASGTWTGNGFHILPIDIHTANASSPYSNYTLFCNMASAPISGGGVIHGVYLYEW
jgi:hypothetical protein